MGTQGEHGIVELPVGGDGLSGRASLGQVACIAEPPEHLEAARRRCLGADDDALDGVRGDADQRSREVGVTACGRCHEARVRALNPHVVRREAPTAKPLNEAPDPAVDKTLGVGGAEARDLHNRARPAGVVDLDDDRSEVLRVLPALGGLVQVVDRIAILLTDANARWLRDPGDHHMRLRAKGVVHREGEVERTIDIGRHARESLVAGLRVDQRRRGANGDELAVAPQGQPVAAWRVPGALEHRRQQEPWAQPVTGNAGAHVPVVRIAAVVGVLGVGDLLPLAADGEVLGDLPPLLAPTGAPQRVQRPGHGQPVPLHQPPEP